MFNIIKLYVLLTYIFYKWGVNFEIKNIFIYIDNDVIYFNSQC